MLTSCHLADSEEHSANSMFQSLSTDDVACIVIMVEWLCGRGMEEIMCGIH